MTQRAFAISSCLLLASLTLSRGEARAQSSTVEATQQEESAEQAGKLATIRDESSPHLSLVDGLRRGARNRIGVEVALTEFYTPDVFQTGSKRQSASFTFLSSRLYTNFSRGTSQIYLDYGLGYRRDNGNTQLDSTTHTASLTWQRVVSRNASLSVSNYLNIGPNDYASSPISSNLVAAPYIFSQEILVGRQRLTRNSLFANLTSRVGKRTSIGIFASHDATRYETSDFRNSQIGQVGINVQHQLNRWVFIESGYGTYLNWVDPRYRRASIQRLRAIGFRLKPRPWMQLSASGGVEYARGVGKHTTGDIDGGLSLVSRSTDLSVNYHYGLSSSIGAGSVLAGHYGTVMLNHTLTRRMSFQIAALYSRATATSNSLYESLSADSGFQFALHHDLITALHYNYISQRAGNLAFEAPQLHRSAVYLGLYYFLPPLRGR